MIAMKYSDDQLILTELVYFFFHGDDVPSFVCGEPDALELVVNLNVFTPLVFLPEQTNKNISTQAKLTDFHDKKYTYLHARVKEA